MNPVDVDQAASLRNVAVNKAWQKKHYNRSIGLEHIRKAKREIL